ncbi:MAG: 16S rRNA (cytidine(1402)-2'-O)-methyltransferase [Syntrophobacteraceae bacterium]
MPSNPAADKKTTDKAAKLYIVSTPIGNLADITLRALETLRSVDLIAAEDTRHTRKLLSFYDIHKPLVSYHEHNARQRGEELLEKMTGGKNIAVVTDAGTPGISDPGILLIEAALRQGIEPVAIPGPTALIAALVISGLPSHPFAFLAFPPVKGAQRRRFFEQNAALAMTLVLYEAPKRLAKTLKEILKVWGDRRVAVARELTKMFEEIYRGRVSEALEHFSGEVRGELTLVVEGNQPESDEGPDSSDWKSELRVLLEGGASSKEAASNIAGRYDLARRIVYQAALEMKQK